MTGPFLFYLTMPYELKDNCVYKVGEKEPIKCHDTKQMAMAHLAALRLNVNEATMETEQHAMIALYPSLEVAQQLALPEGEPPEDLHITIAYLGEVEKLYNTDLIKGKVGEWALHIPILEGRINGLGRFTETHKEGLNAIWAHPDLPKLPDCRWSLMRMLDEECDCYLKSEHGYTPHITLAYIDSAAPFPIQTLPVIPLHFEYISVVIGEERTDYRFGITAPMMSRRVEPIKVPRPLQENIRLWLRKSAAV